MLDSHREVSTLQPSVASVGRGVQVGLRQLREAREWAAKGEAGQRLSGEAGTTSRVASRLFPTQASAP